MIQVDQKYSLHKFTNRFGLSKSKTLPSKFIITCSVDIMKCTFNFNAIQLKTLLLHILYDGLKFKIDKTSYTKSVTINSKNNHVHYLIHIAVCRQIPKCR